MDKKFEEKFEEVKANTKETCSEVWKEAKKAGRWIKDNPKEALAIATGVLTAVGFATRGVTKLSNHIQDTREAKDLKKRIWNPVAGEYLYTKKPLTGAQKLEFEQRIASGESRAAILKSMGLLDMTR